MKPRAMHSSIEELCLAVRSCKDLVAVRKEHSNLVQFGLDAHCYIGCYLIRMFCSFGSVSDAIQVFHRLPQPNVFAFSGIISGFACQGNFHGAFQFYLSMLELEIMPDGYTFVSVVKACSFAPSLVHGFLVHFQIVELGFDSDAHVCNSLVDIYGKKHNVHDARKVFDTMPTKDIVSWNSVIAVYVQNDHAHDALQMFNKMEDKGFKPDNVTLVNVLKACSDKAFLNMAKVLHAYIVERDLNVDAFVWSTLVDIYGKCGDVKDAYKVFGLASRMDVITCNSLMAVYALHGPNQDALHLFKQLFSSGLVPDKVTFITVLKAVAGIGVLDEGMLIHCLVAQFAFDIHTDIRNSLLDMYCKCQSLDDANAVFEHFISPDVATWSTLISGYCQLGLVDVAFQIFQKMQSKGFKPNLITWNALISGYSVVTQCTSQALVLFTQMQREGIMPDSTTYVAILKACANLMDIDQGKLVHALTIEDGNQLNVFVGNMLIDMYAKCGNIHDARAVFGWLPSRDVVTWNSLIEGFVHHGYEERAIELFHEMQHFGLKPDKTTIISALKACSTTTSVKEGMLVHESAVLNSFESDNLISNSLIDMYAKCGKLYEATNIFGGLPKDHVETWNTIMSGHAVNGKYNMVIQYYKKFRQYGLRPDGISFLCLLSACSHLGLVNEGRNHFLSMKGFGLTPTVEHYNCMIDLWGRIGCLKEAHQVLQAIPSKPTIVSWICLLNHCRTYGRLELAQHCLDNVKSISCQSASAYALLSNILADIGRQAEHLEGESIKTDWKVPGKAFIEVGREVHCFLVGDRSHSLSDIIWISSKRMNALLVEHGYIPHSDLVIHL